MRRQDLFWGVLVVVLGALLLLDNLGLFGDLNIWSLIGPILLIFLGVWILVGVRFRSAARTESLAIPRDSTQEAILIIRHGAGRLKIAPGASPGNLVEGQCGGGVEVRSRDTGRSSQSKLILSLPVQFFPFVWFPGSLSGYEWDLKLNPELTYQIDLNTGAGESDLDFNQLLVTHLVIKTGASSNTIRASEIVNDSEIRVESGVSSVKILIPESVAAQISTQGGLTDVRVDRDRFPRQGGVYRSPGYEAASKKVRISVQTGVGSVIIS